MYKNFCNREKEMVLFSQAYKDAVEQQKYIDIPEIARRAHAGSQDDVGKILGQGVMI